MPVISATGGESGRGADLVAAARARDGSYEAEDFSGKVHAPNYPY